jgi:hypothetical protein
LAKISAADLAEPNVALRLGVMQGSDTIHAYYAFGDFTSLPGSSAYTQLSTTDAATDLFAVKDFALAGFGNFVPVTAGVPEPSTWAMMALGFAGLGYAGYRTRRPAAAAAL